MIGMAPAALLVFLALVLLFFRPWMEARRPLDAPALAIGLALGPALGVAPPSDPASALAPVYALAVGWLVLSKAEPWGSRTLRETGAPLRLPLLLVPAMAVGGAVWLAWRSSDRMTAAIVAGCAALALDPDAVRDLLGRTARPGPAARKAPSIAGLSLGLALVLGAAAVGGGSPRILLAYPLGLAAGLVLAGLLRIAQGKGMLLVLLATASVVGWGLARRLDLSPLATLLVAGAILADDPVRRDLVFSALAEYERAFRTAMLILAGFGLTVSLDPFRSAGVWGIVAALVILRPLAWRLAPGLGLTFRQALPISPLAVPLALTTGHVPIGLAVCLAWSLCEAASHLPAPVQGRAS